MKSLSKILRAVIAAATLSFAHPAWADLITNGGFETGSFAPGWVIDGFNNPPVVSTANPHSGTYSAAAGDFAPLFSTSEPFGDSSFYQQFTVPASGGILSFWHWDYTTDTIFFDWQDAYITDSSGTILATIFHQCLNDPIWTNQTFDMAPYAGQTVRVKFLVHQDGFGDDTGMYVDDVSVNGAVVPEPFSSLWLALPFAGMVAFRRFRT